VTGADSAAAVHSALIYSGPEEFLATVVPYLQTALAAGEQALVLTDGEKIDWLRRELGEEAKAIEFAATGPTHQRQAQVIQAVIERVVYGRCTRIVAEQALARRSPREVDDYLRFEAAWNVAFRTCPISILCPYDASALPADVVLGCQRTHPALAAKQHTEPSCHFVDPSGYIAGSCVVTAPPASAEEFCCCSKADLAAARAFVRVHATRAGLGTKATAELSLAVSEVVTNALDYGKAPRLLYAYDEGSMLVCHVHDSGDGPGNPLASYLPPGTGPVPGRGLWVARQLCDSLEIATDATGTHVRLFTLPLEYRKPLS
jgi:anti-sigma regulatory factor (Ser/Thr protein kinase)